MSDVLQKLLFAESDFLAALPTIEEDLPVYDSAWTSLLDEVSQASALGDISNKTLAVADDVVARISTLVECCLSLSSVPFPSLNDSPPSPFHTNTSFVPEAYSWLLENIANPYPSAKFKTSLARRYNSPLSSVNSWFVNARRRMGWTALCRDFFHNCRADAVAAACRVLVKGDTDPQLGSEVIHAFVAIKVTAEELYATYEKTVLAGDLDIVFKDMFVEDQQLAKDDQRDNGKRFFLEEPEEYTREQPTCVLEVSQKNLPSMGALNLSHASSPLSSPDDTLIDKNTSSPLLAGRKRRLSSLDVDTTRAASGSVKRPRFSSSSPNACPSSSSTRTDLGSDQTSHTPQTQNTVNVNSHPRHPSDSNTTVSTEELSLCSVSDPSVTVLDGEYSIDEWFNTNFDTIFTFPPPVDVVEPDLSTQWEVELFNNYSIPDDLPMSLTPRNQDNRIASCAALEDLLKPLENGEFVAVPEVTPTPPLVADSVSHGLPLLPDLSQSIDWAVFFNDDCESTNEPFFFDPTPTLFPQTRSIYDSTFSDLDRGRVAVI